MKKEYRLITAALPFVNNVPHLGNIVGSHLPADIFYRYCKLSNYECLFIGGTDEHGTTSEVAALKNKITPEELCDFYFKVHKDIYDWFNFNYDNFSRTSNKHHHEFVKSFFLELYKKGYFIEGKLNLPYCNNCKRQLPDRFIEGNCPFCNYEGARGDQCEKCSKLLDPEKLKNPKCALCNLQNIEFKNEKHLFFDLSKLSKKLEKWIKSNKHWRPQVRETALAWIKEGLRPRCITRDLSWGINVPLKRFENKVFYVWLENALGYISFTKEHTKNWIKYWKSKQGKVYHFIGKDNIPFHTIFFPAELLAHGKFNLPHNVVGLQYLNYEGGKFSKSKNRGVFCENLSKTGLDSDYWRFYLSYIIPETKDTDFSWKEFENRINSELNGNFGNYINRVLKFISNNFDKNIPTGKVDKKLEKKVKKQIKIIKNSFEKVELRKALKEILVLSDIGNKYFDEKKPWTTKNKDVLFNCANLCKILGLIISPFLPKASQKILNMLNCEEKNWIKVDKFNLKNHKINEPVALFKIIEKKEIDELKRITSNVTEFNILIETPKLIKEEKIGLIIMDKIKFSDWQKLDLRVGKIKAVKDHPNAEKLYILLVDIGPIEQNIQLVAGLKEHYAKDELMNKKVIVFRNLEPAVIRGEESAGMVLAAVKEKKVTLITPDKDIDIGARIQ